jgi:hypothetical protein
MIAKVQASKQKSRSSFKRLLNYLTKEVDPETGETLLRGEAVLSNNLVGIDTAAAEMKAVESLNLRCDDAVCHYELAWPPGERPTRAQWMDAAEYTLDQLGYKDHQYVVVAHDDKKHFHIHIMLNKVHPETYKAHTPYRNWITRQYARSKPNTAGPTLSARPAGTRPLKRLCEHPDPSAMSPGRFKTRRTAPPQNTSTITMKNPSRPMYVGKLLRVYERC